MGDNLVYLNSLLASIVAAAALLALVPTATDASSSSDLVVSIPLESQNGTPAIALHDNKSSFPVVLKNRGSAPIKIWTAGCSFGYSALTLEWTDASGKTVRVTRKPVVFKQNTPMTLTIAPGASTTVEVAPASSGWVGAPLPAPGSSARVTLRAVYHIPADSLTRQYGVWTGTATSRAVAATVVR
jgi:hypothetical protein